MSGLVIYKCKGNSVVMLEDYRALQKAILPFTKLIEKADYSIGMITEKDIKNVKRFL